MERSVVYMNYFAKVPKLQIFREEKRGFFS